MSTDVIDDLVGGNSELVSWETWDNIKHTERFVWVSTIVFVALFSWVFSSAPVVADFTQGYHGLARTILMWAIFALGFNLLLGQTGLLSFGHALFWGTGGYAAALVGVHLYGDPLLMVFVGALTAFVFAFLSAIVLLRLHSVYFAIVTLAIAQLVWALSREPLYAITRGINGINVDAEPLFGVFDLYARQDGLLGTLFVDNMYIFIGLFFLATVAFIARVRKSPYGLIFKAVRENETRASFVGLDVWRYKFAAYLLSGTIVGVGGSLLAMESNLAVVSRLHWSVSGDIVVIAVLGGLGTLAGPVIGTIVFYWFQGVFDGFQWTIPGLEFLGSVGQYWLLLLALAFTAVVWRYPDGIWGMITDFTASLREPKQLPKKAKAKITRGGSNGGSNGGDR